MQRMLLHMPEQDAVHVKLICYDICMTTLCSYVHRFEQALEA